MKKLLSILGAISLVATSTTSLVACNTPQEYTKEELEHLKKENQIDTKNKEIRDNLEWIAPQEKPFDKIDNKYYYVVWRNDKSNDWRINKFNNNSISISIVMDNYPNLGKFRGRLQISNSATDRILLENDDGTYFKSVYRWNGEEQKLPNLIADKDGNVKVNGE